MSCTQSLLSDQQGSLTKSLVAQSGPEAPHDDWRSSTSNLLKRPLYCALHIDNMHHNHKVLTVNLLKLKQVNLNKQCRHRTDCSSREQSDLGLHCFQCLCLFDAFFSVDKIKTDTVINLDVPAVRVLRHSWK